MRNISNTNNCFEGPIRKTLLNLLTSSPSSFSGNPGLCVSCLSFNCSKNSDLKPCDAINNMSTRRRKIKVGLIAAASSIFVIVLLYGVVCKFLSGIFCKHKSTSFLEKILLATENLNDRYIIGRGAHGVVYKVNLGPENIVAIKKLEFANEEGQSKSMRRELETIGKIKHRNLVRLNNFWLRKEYGLILYNFMENGSLHDVLHERNPAPVITWSVRYNIAVGIAHGLAYLHYDCDPTIVHRDIKPKNILLDADMEPHIADFGIAKFLDQSFSSTQSIAVPGTIGYIAPGDSPL